MPSYTRYKLPFKFLQDIYKRRLKPTLDHCKKSKKIIGRYLYIHFYSLPVFCIVSVSLKRTHYLFDLKLWIFFPEVFVSTNPNCSLYLVVCPSCLVFQPLLVVQKMLYLTIILLKTVPNPQPLRSLPPPPAGTTLPTPFRGYTPTQPGNPLRA